MGLILFTPYYRNKHYFKEDKHMNYRLEIHWENGSFTAFPNVTKYSETDSEIKITFGDCDEANQSDARIFKEKVLFMERIKK